MQGIQWRTRTPPSKVTNRWRARRTGSLKGSVARAWALFPPHTVYGAEVGQVDQPWHALTPEEALARLGSDPERGLTEADARQRLGETGPNRLVSAPPTPWWRRLLEQFTDFMVLVLIAATAVSMVLGEAGDALAILAIVVMNALLGFYQEGRAQKAALALQSLTAPQAQVVRGGRVGSVDAETLVPGDVLVLGAGDRVAADARLLAAVSLAVDEATLTGESHAAAKRIDRVGDPRAALADRRNMVFLGSAVARGRGWALVVSTGMATEMGQVQHLMNQPRDERTPLERRLEHLGRILVFLAMAIVLGVVGIGVLRGEPLYLMFLTGVSLAVAAVPEGLPAIVTMALALGVQRMIRAHAIVRKLPAVETLGCTTVICSDKTGTLTKNQMTVLDVYAGGARRQRRSSQEPFQGPEPMEPGDADRLFQGAVLASTAELADESQGVAVGQGDPTELAMLAAAVRGGQAPQRVWSRHQRIAEVPFSAEERRMTVVVRNAAQQHVAFVKGAPDTLLARANFIWWHGRVAPLDAGRRAAWIRAHEEMTAQALRVLAVAFRPLAPAEASDPAHWDVNLVLLGLMGMMDPPRPDAVEAVRLCRRAGLMTVMITGDHPDTALAIARQMGIAERREELLTGQGLDALDDSALAREVAGVRVFARVSPPHKLRVVEALRRQRQVVAMTGDGVNDAPALRAADIGIAMGSTGTDVAKEAAAMILTDDNFATIVRAIQEGRAIYDNIRKFLRYLLSCNVGEVLVMFLAVALNLPLPLLPIQILFVNLVTDGLPALALGVDPPDPAVMTRPPLPPSESTLARGLGAKIVVRGLLIGVTTVLVFFWALTLGGLGMREARTLALATLVMSQLFHVFDARVEDRNFLEVGLFTNPWAVAAVASSVALLVAITYVPSLSLVFKTDPLNAGDWVLVVGASGFIQAASAVRHLFRGAPAAARTPL